MLLPKHLSVACGDSSPQGEPYPLPPLEGRWHGVSRDGEVAAPPLAALRRFPPQGGPSHPESLPLRGGAANGGGEVSPHPIKRRIILPMSHPVFDTTEALEKSPLPENQAITDPPQRSPRKPTVRAESRISAAFRPNELPNQHAKCRENAVHHRSSCDDCRGLLIEPDPIPNRNSQGN